MKHVVVSYSSSDESIYVRNEGDKGSMLQKTIQEETIITDFFDNLDRITPEKMDAFIKSL